MSLNLAPPKSIPKLMVGSHVCAIWDFTVSLETLCPTLH